MPSTRTAGPPDLLPEARKPTQTARTPFANAPAPRSEWMFEFFARVFEGTLRNGFRAVRIAAWPLPAICSAPHLVVYANHPSWWDGALYIHLAKRLFAGRPVYTPIDAAMLEKYRFFGRIGAFGVEQGRARGARRFLEACRAIFADPSNVMIISAQGRFVDPRARPLRLDPGVAHICDIAPGAVFLPLAVEYTYWTEKRPEALLRFGGLVRGDELVGLPAAERLERLEAALTSTMDQLAAASIARDRSAFETILQGRSGIDVFYDTWRRAKALVGGRAFHPGHGEET